MLRCTQHDSAVTHTDAWINLLHCIIGPRWLSHYPKGKVNLHDKRPQQWQKYPDAWGRIQQRHNFMRDALGIRFKPEVFPFSNIPAYLPPFWLSPQRAMSVV